MYTSFHRKKSEWMYLTLCRVFFAFYVTLDSFMMRSLLLNAIKVMVLFSGTRSRLASQTDDTHCPLFGQIFHWVHLPPVWKSHGGALLPPSTKPHLSGDPGSWLRHSVPISSPSITGAYLLRLEQAFFWTFRKKTQGQKTQAKKNSSKFSKNSSKSFKNSIICQLKTDFLLKKVLKLVYLAQKFAQT